MWMASMAGFGRGGARGARQGKAGQGEGSGEIY
jgi:hypothetical protein